MEKQATWIRVAGNATNIKANHPQGWRCYIGEDPTEIPLKNWYLNGFANPKNFIPGFDANRDSHDLVAWIDCFGSCIIENETLHIALGEPTTPPPSHKA